jgi:hypothetical protein
MGVWGYGAAAALMLVPLLQACGEEPEPVGAVEGALLQPQQGSAQSSSPGGCPLWLQCPPVPTTLATAVKPTSIVSDGTTLWFTNNYDMIGTRALKMPVAGGVPQSLVSGTTYHDSIGLGAGRVFWAETGTSTGGVWSALTSASVGTNISPAIDDLQRPQNLEVRVTPHALPGDVHAFWGSDYKAQLYDVHYQVSPLFPGLVFLSTTPLLPSSSSVLLCKGGSALCYPWSVTADNTNVYFGDDDAGYIYRIPWAGGAPVQLTQGDIKSLITTDGTSVFFVKSGFIRQVPVGGGLVTTFAPVSGTISSLKTRGGILYWTCSDCGTVMKQSIGGGAATTLASGQISPRAIAIDDTYVFWGTTTALKRIPK